MFIKSPCGYKDCRKNEARFKDTKALNPMIVYATNFCVVPCIVHFATAKENIYDDTSELSHPFSVIRRGKFMSIPLSLVA